MQDLLPIARGVARRAGIPRHKQRAWARGWIAGFTSPQPANPYAGGTRMDVYGAWESGLLAGLGERSRRNRQLVKDAEQLKAEILASAP